MPTRFNSYLDSYFEYFGPKVSLFASVSELKDLNDSGSCMSYWVDIDNARQNILDSLHDIKKTELVIIANVTSRDKLEKLGATQDNVLYKPVTLKKIRETLLRETSKEREEVRTVAEGVHFDARALVAEDNIINQKLIRHILEESGLKVEIANSGLEAIEKRRNKEFDIIFMDIQMPEMDGIEAPHEILDYEEDEKMPHIPIIALTANALAGDRERLLNEGLDEYISKPLETSELLAVLNKFLRNKAAAVSDTTYNPEPETKTALQDAKSEAKPMAETSEKKILIAKRSLLEGRILAKVIKNLKMDYEILDSTSDLTSEVVSGKYDILIADRDLLPDDSSQIEESVAVIALSDREEDHKAFNVAYGESISHYLSREKLETLIKKYRQ
jgi:CheY-like chemotaxis protein